MNALSSTELTTFNQISEQRKNGILLGTKINEIIGTFPSELTPVNAVNATKTLTLLGVVVDGENVTINNPLKTGSDIYEFCADSAQTVSNVGNIPVNITASTTKSSGTLTVAVQPTSGDTMTIGGKTYTFVPVGTANADGEISIGADLAGAKLAIVAAINGTDNINDPHPSVSAAAFVADACAITALVGGVAGDSIGTTETFTSGSNLFAAETLGSGADCTAANAITALVAAITASDTQDVGAEDGDGDTVVLTADVAGAAGNNIVIGENITNATFAAGATALSGGVNGTVGVENQICRDGTYLYVCIADNTVADKNWRRISLGSAY